jgi:16S rRNA (guanine1207-N2)-methyltransferase
MSADDTVLDVLFLPIATGAVAVPSSQRVLFLRARCSPALQRHANPQWVCEQSFKPEADRLRAAGWIHAAEHDERFALILILPPRSREEARILFAQAVQRLAPGGCVLACAANNQGARSLQEDLRQLVGHVTGLSKHHCRVFWAWVETADIDAALLATWTALDTPRAVAGSSLLSRPGVFSADAIDVASGLLVEHLPTHLAGRAADFGAGNGYLSIALLARNPGIVAIDLYEAEARALEVARLNLAMTPTTAKIGCHWHDIATGVSTHPDHAGYDVIVMNPPFHQGRADAPDLGRAFIIAAAAALKPGGQLWLVANRHLPYEVVLAQHFTQIREVIVRDGFKVITARKSA